MLTWEPVCFRDHKTMMTLPPQLDTNINILVCHISNESNIRFPLSSQQQKNINIQKYLAIYFEIYY